MKSPAIVSAILFSFSVQIPMAQQTDNEVAPVKTGILPQGKFNAITDVAGVMVGQYTLVQGDSVRTGVTAILPHGGNIFQKKVPAAIFTGNGFGKLAGSTQVMELGNIETPIVLTNTLSVPTAMNAVISYTLHQKEMRMCKA